MGVRVLYSFPHKIGASRICSTAWYQVAGATEAGAELVVLAGAVEKPLGPDVDVRTTLARGRWRIPYSAVGHMRALALHDRIVARQIPQLRGQIDVVHAWPLASCETLRAARQAGIPTVLERPNAHTRFAMEAVAEEGRRIGVALPPDHEHAYNAVKLAKEEQEYQLADYLLCPSEFVIDTFMDRGFAREKLLRHIYGYDEHVFHPPSVPGGTDGHLRALFVGVCAVRKGLHFALEAWLRSDASSEGTLTIAGEFLPEYEQKLAPMLSHKSIQVLGHRNDVPELMRSSHILFLPSIEEGFGLTCVEAIGSNCVPLVSTACTDTCAHEENALVHSVGDVETLTHHINIVCSQPNRLRQLQDGCSRSAPNLTWSAAGRRLVEVYERVAYDNKRLARRGQPIAL